MIKLERPDGYKASQGAKFILSFTKARHLAGSQVEPLEVELVSDAQGNYSWKHSGKVPPNVRTIIETLQSLGGSCLQSALVKNLESSGVPVPTPYRHIKAAIGQGVKIKGEGKGQVVSLDG